MPAPTTPPPESLGRYRVVRRLGAGGMAEVFLAKTAGAEGIEKVLVVKRVLPTFARSAKFISMFVDEAKVAMRLNHPNIVQVYAFEQVSGELVLAMEFVDGLDLGRLIATARREGRRLSHALSAFLVMEVAKGLERAEAHEGAEHALCVLGIGTHEDVQIPRGAGRAVCREGVSAHDQEVAPLHAKARDYVDEVVGSRLAHRSGRCTRPGISARA